MAHPATEKRGGNPDVKHKTERQKPKDAMERKLEQGLEVLTLTAHRIARWVFRFEPRL